MPKQLVILRVKQIIEIFQSLRSNKVVRKFKHREMQTFRYKTILSEWGKVLGKSHLQKGDLCRSIDYFQAK